MNIFYTVGSVSELILDAVFGSFYRFFKKCDSGDRFFVIFLSSVCIGFLTVLYTMAIGPAIERSAKEKIAEAKRVEERQQEEVAMKHRARRRELAHVADIEAVRSHPDCARYDVDAMLRNTMTRAGLTYGDIENVVESCRIGNTRQAQRELLGLKD